mmetsp:Transcript_10147/g.15202  ORF Transcript_10147/g.15202 Transcript_10147/m.15202 type:complete len:949 (+) Transcript_10147:121-2967(+)
MKAKRRGTTSKWKDLAWEKVNINSSAAEDNGDDIDDSKFLNAKNHYDDPNADPLELYESVVKGNDNSNSKYEYEPDNVEGADDPGIFVGLEVIDGSQYQLEKVQVGSGYITRLVIEGDKEKRDVEESESRNEVDPSNNKDSSKNMIKSVSNVVEETKKKSNSKDMEEKSNTEEDPSTRKKLTRKERNRLKLEKMKAKRLEKKAERKRKRAEGRTCLEPNQEKTDKKVQKKSSNSDVTEKRKKKEPQIKMEKEKQKLEPVSQADINTIRNAWSIGTSGVYLHEKICSSLHRMNFASPTPIQASTLAASILGRRDVVGAAPTGSGKTLSYLLPILQYLLSVEDDRNGNGSKQGTTSTPIESKLTALILCPTRELAMQVSNEYAKLIKSTANEPYFNRIKCGSIVGGLSEQKQKRVLSVNRPSVLVGTPGRLWDLMSSGEHEHLSNLTQLRFLVVDEADRMVSQGSFPQLSSILGKIRIANPSLEDMQEVESDSESDTEDRLKSLPGIRGEAKVSMLNDDILKMIQQQSQHEKPTTNEDEEGEESLDIEEESMSFQSSEDEEESTIFVKRQTFIFSATLTLPSSSESNTTTSNTIKKRKRHKSVDGVIAEILYKVGAQGQTKIVDLSTEVQENESKPKEGMHSDAMTPSNKSFKLPPGLSLYEIRCTQKHKDSHLYSFLTTTKQGSSGPCLVFCNSIGAVKRVGETLKTLGLPIRMLHAQMQQKARMNAVESITESNSRSIVVASDVAARGLDIPSVATVVHYDVPRATDLFVHRAGRTARGVGKSAVGWSVSLISAREEKNHQRICQRISGKKHFDTAPMDGRLMSAAQERVNLASKIVACTDSESKTKKSNQWFIDAAKDADLDLDEHMLDVGLAGGNNKERQSLLEAKQARQQLQILLSRPMRKQSYGKFLSGAGISEAMKTEQEVKPFVVPNGQKGTSKNKRRKLRN